MNGENPAIIIPNAVNFQTQNGWNLGNFQKVKATYQFIDPKKNHVFFSFLWGNVRFVSAMKFHRALHC